MNSTIEKIALKIIDGSFHHEIDGKSVQRFLDKYSFTYRLWLYHRFN